jgi:hypothetical protein
MLFIIYVLLTFIIAVFLYDSIDTFINEHIKSIFWRNFCKILAMSFILILFFAVFFYLCIKTKQ